MRPQSVFWAKGPWAQLAIEPLFRNLRSHLVFYCCLLHCSFLLSHSMFFLLSHSLFFSLSHSLFFLLSHSLCFTLLKPKTRFPCVMGPAPRAKGACPVGHSMPAAHSGFAFSFVVLLRVHSFFVLRSHSLFFLLSHSLVFVVSFIIVFAVSF